MGDKYFLTQSRFFPQYAFWLQLTETFFYEFNRALINRLCLRMTFFARTLSEAPNTHTLSAERHPARVFLGTPMGVALQDVVYRRAFPCPVRTIGRLLSDLSILPFSDSVRFL